MRKKDTYGLSSTEAYCAGCGENHDRGEMVQICIKCIQLKFIPRLEWYEVGFMDKKSFEQWWNHVVKVNKKALLKLIEKQQKKLKVRAEWLGGLTDKEDSEDEEDDKAFEEFLNHSTT